MRYDIISPRERNGKTYWQKIGAGFPRDNNGYSLVFDALPLPDKDGRVNMLMVEAKPREDGPAEKPGSDVDSVPDDEIPF